MTSNMEILIEQIKDTQERQSFLRSLNPEKYSSDNLHKITINISDDEQSKIFALLSLDEKLAGTNRTEVIKSLINIGFNHIVEQTYDLYIDTGYKYKTTENNIFCTLGHYLRLMDLNHRRATLRTENMQFNEPDDLSAAWSKEYFYLMNEDLDDFYESEIKREAKQQELEARGQ